MVKKTLNIADYDRKGFELIAELVDYQYMHEYYVNKQKGYTPEWWDEKFKASEPISTTVIILFQKMESGWSRISPDEKMLKHYQSKAGTYRKYLE